MASILEHTKPVFGWSAFAFGAVALIAALVTFWAGPFAPQQTAGVSLGELAAEITKSAARSVAGLEQPAPQKSPLDLDDYLKISVAVLGGLAVILASVGFIRKEPLRVTAVGAGLGSAAILFQFFVWMVLAVLGTLLVMALIYALRDSLGSILGG